MYRLVYIGMQWYVLNDKGVKIPVDSEMDGILLIKELELKQKKE